MPLEKIQTTTNSNPVVAGRQQTITQNAGAKAYSDYVQEHLQQKKENHSNSVSREKKDPITKQLEDTPAAQVQISDFGRTRMKEYQEAKAEQIGDKPPSKGEQDSENNKDGYESNSLDDNSTLMKAIDGISQIGQIIYQFVLQTIKGIGNAFRNLVKSDDKKENDSSVPNEEDDDYEIDTIQGRFDISVDGDQIQKNQDVSMEFAKEIVKEQGKTDSSGNIDVRI